MEDHLTNKARLDTEWAALCAYDADPCSVAIAQLVRYFYLLYQMHRILSNYFQTNYSNRVHHSVFENNLPVLFYLHEFKNNVKFK